MAGTANLRISGTVQERKSSGVDGTGELAAVPAGGVWWLAVFRVAGEGADGEAETEGFAGTGGIQLSADVDFCAVAGFGAWGFSTGEALSGSAALTCPADFPAC